MILMMMKLFITLLQTISMTSEDKANNIFLEFYTHLVVMDELFEVVVIKELAIKMAIVHVNIVKDNNYLDIIKHLKEIK